MKNFRQVLCSINTVLCFIVYFLFCPLSVAANENIESISHLKTLIDQFVVDHVAHDEDETVSVIINQLENLKLSPCSGNIMVSFSKDSTPSQPSAVALSCDSANSWSVFIPIRVELMTKVISTVRTISPGEIITESDLGYESVDKNRLYEGYFKDKREVIGLSASRSISTGTPLTKKNVKQLPVVKRNQTVTLTLRKGTIEVQMIGIAKSDGFLNGPVKVYNPSSKKMVDAVATGKDMVEITY